MFGLQTRKEVEALRRDATRMLADASTAWKQAQDGLWRDARGLTFEEIQARILEERARERLQPPPSPLTPPAETERDMEPYDAIAAEIGLRSAAISVSRLRRWMAKRELPCWETAAVVRYLHRLSEGTQVVWLALRGEDNAWPSGVLQRGSATFNGTRLYEEAVPFVALRLVRDIEKELGKEYDFLVSAYEAVRPDPFLLAIPKRSLTSGIVICHWDEPGFDVKPLEPVR